MSVIPPELRPDSPPACLQPVVPTIDGQPRRAVASYNVRHDEKLVADFLQAYWVAKLGRPLAHWDVFSILLAAALENPKLDVPDQLRFRRKR